MLPFSILHICSFLTVLFCSSHSVRTSFYSFNSAFYSLLTDFNWVNCTWFLYNSTSHSPPNHLSYWFYISERSILMAFCFCFREGCFLAFFWVSPLIVKIFLLIFLVNHFQSFVSFLIRLLDNVTCFVQLYLFKNHKNFILLVCFLILLRVAVYLDNL